ncbi:MAG: hypothetical protein WAW96_00580 [Alphaproteobacteria bacterium]
MFWAIHGVMQFTVLAVIGFFILVVATKCTGLLSLWGKLLGAWLYALAILVVVFAVVAPLAGWHIVGENVGGRGPGPWMGRWGHPRWEKPAAPPAAPAVPGQPAAPAQAPSSTTSSTNP